MLPGFPSTLCSTPKKSGSLTGSRVVGNIVRCEVGGWPPLVLCFEHSYDRDAVLGKAHLLERSDTAPSHLTVPRTGILITEDMARCTRGQWGELRKFMLKVPDSSF